MTAMSDSLYQTLVHAGVPVGVLRSTSRTLRGANGTPIGISGCSHYVVSFTEFPILVCDLSTYAIIGTDTLGSVLPHTLDINILFMDGGVSLQFHRIDTALSGRVFTIGHCSIPPYSEAVLHCTMRTVGGWICWICWPVNNGSPPWIWQAVIGRFHCRRRHGSRQHSRRNRGCFSSKSCRLDFATLRPHLRD